jgi:hypothetical protein
LSQSERRIYCLDCLIYWLCQIEAIQSFELLSKFIAKEAVIPDALILVSALGASAFHVQAALGPGTQAHRCAFRIGVEMNIMMMKVGCHMQPMRKFCQ